MFIALTLEVLRQKLPNQITVFAQLDFMRAIHLHQRSNFTNSAQGVKFKKARSFNNISYFASIDKMV